ncbi:putative ribosomally synthesized peptide with SipW-like signal peptide [Lachnospiraceae bacterium PM6-15]|uniref:SipW-dependent-type signal peptide-containing protein n=1 Tax=Ohessyouella blattaphilus TaxID=2949333 RepID=UPI003E20BF69
MSKKRKIVSLVVAVALIAAIGIGATLAYLSATTTVVENTFAVGNVNLDIWETEIVDKDEDGKMGPTKDNDYMLTPSQEDKDGNPLYTQSKDPYITLGADSEDAYVFMLVTGVDDAEAALIMTDDFDSNWTKIANADGVIFDADADVPVVDDEKKDGVYAYATALSKNGRTDSLFTKIWLDKAFEKLGADTSFPEMKFYGAAIQAHGFADADAAYAALGSDWVTTVQQ